MGSNYPIGDTPYSLVAAKITEDSNLDLAVVNQRDHNLSILPGDGMGNFGAAKKFSTGFNPLSVVASDYNLDKKWILLLRTAVMGP